MVDVKQAQQTLLDYKKGKANLDARIRENERWYKLRHWEMAHRSKNEGDPEPTSAWLFNSLANKHADAMDNFPEPAVLPREESDRQTAQVLSGVLPVVLEQQRFEDVYDKHWWRKLRTGTGVYGVFWDKNLMNGLGDVVVKDIDLLSLYWEPGVDDIQNSPNVFYTTLVDNDALKAAYPQMEGKLGDAVDQAQYIHDESIDTSKKSVVVDWYYKRRDGTRTVLHYCKFVGNEILYSSEDTELEKRRQAELEAQTAGVPMADAPAEGFYRHGLYPFVFDTLFPVEDSPVGFGWLDVCKDPQLYIDKLGQSILKSAVIGSRRRYFSRADGGVNEQEYADLSKDFVHYQGGDPSESIMPIETPPLNAVYVNVLQSKVDELKETSGNRDFSQGGTSGGVSAASAIAALQEAGSKLSRDMIRASYRAFERVCNLVIELIRQFYEEPRTFRITGAYGAEEFATLTNRQMMMQPQGQAFGVDLGAREPVYDIKVRAQKRNAFSTLAQNEMAKEFFAAGFFNPQLSDQALACIEMMDFEGKQQVEQRIRQNGGMYQQMMQMQQQMAQMSEIINRLTGGALGQPDGEAKPAQPTRAQAEAATNDGIRGNSREALAMRARQRAQSATEVK